MNKIINKNNIKDVELFTEGDYSIRIPYDCFTQLDFIINENLSKEKDNYIVFSHLDFNIKDNGKISFFNENAFRTDKDSPVQILDKYDITGINLVFNDNTNQNIHVLWYNENQEDWNYESHNIEESTNLIDYKTIHIKIAPYIPIYYISDIFNLPTNTILKAEDKSEYIILADGDDMKYLAHNNKTKKEVILDSRHTSMKYIIIKQK